MIVFDLQCAPQGHVFEAWFGSSADYASQQSKGIVRCPICNAARVGKAATAPRLSAGEPDETANTCDPQKAKAMLGALAQAQKKMLESSDYVGEFFADEARAIHVGDAVERSIYGTASREQALSLIEDGIPIAPLPLPLPGVEPGREN